MWIVSFVSKIFIQTFLYCKNVQRYKNELNLKRRFSAFYGWMHPNRNFAQTGIMFQLCSVRVLSEHLE